MSKILVLYGTTDGHTRKIAQALAITLGAEGASVDLRDAKAVDARVRPEGYDAAFILASVHVTNYQRSVKRWVKAHVGELNRIPSAFLSVCLGVLEQNEKSQREVREIPSRFLQQYGWHPTAVKIVAGALPYTRYGWLKKRVLRRIAAKAGGGTDTTRDYEYTDWEALERFAREFLRSEGLTEKARDQSASRASSP